MSAAPDLSVQVVAPGSIIVLRGAIWADGMHDQFVAALTEHIPHQQWVLLNLDADSSVEILNREQIEGLLARLDGSA